MGILDKAKERATQLAEQAKDKIDDVKEKRKVDSLQSDIGRIVYRQRTEGVQAGDEADIARLVSELRTLEAEAKAEVAAASATVDSPQAPPATESSSFPPPL